MTTLSNNSISHYLTCPASFYHYYVRRLVPAVKSPHLTFGEIVHTGCEVLFKGLQQGDSKSHCIDRAIDAVRQQWMVYVNELSGLPAYKDLERATTAMVKVANLNLEELGDIVGVEQEIVVELLPGVNYKSIIDLLLETAEGRVVYDFKTMNDWHGNKDHRLSLNRQLKGYRWAVGAVDACWVPIVFPKKPKKGQEVVVVHQPVSHQPCPAMEIELWLEETVQVADDIHSMLVHDDSPYIWPRSTNDCQSSSAYFTCDYMPLCLPTIRQAGRLDVANVDPTVFVRREDG